MAYQKHVTFRFGQIVSKRPVDSGGDKHDGNQSQQMVFDDCYANDAVRASPHPTALEFGQAWFDEKRDGLVVFQLPRFC